MTSGAEGTAPDATAAERRSRLAVETAAAPPSRRTPERPWFARRWWRYVVGIVVMAFALFPVVYVVSRRRSTRVPSLSTASVISGDVTLDNFRAILTRPDTSPTRTGT